MKVLQIENTEEPRILKAGFDFDIITATGNLLRITNSNPLECDTVCSLDDCYESRPLIEIDGFCEFDVIEYRGTFGIFIIYDMRISAHFSDHECERCLSPIKSNYKKIDKNTMKSNRSIFTKENQEKYPELYTEALELIN